MSNMKRVAPAQARPLQQDLWMRHLGSTSEYLVAVAIDDRDEQKKPVEHSVELKRTRYAGTGARYRVMYLGKTLIESTRDPEFEACRALLAKGVTGTLVTYSPGSSVSRMRIDIAKGAQLMTIDNATGDPR